MDAYTDIDRITIEAQDKERVYAFDPSALPLFRYLAECSSPRAALAGSGKTSRRIICYATDGAELDFGLRLRITSNNGITAMLGRNKKGNKSSSPVIKLQQDKVHDMVASIERGDLTTIRI